MPSDEPTANDLLTLMREAGEPPAQLYSVLVKARQSPGNYSVVPLDRGKYPRRMALLVAFAAMTDPNVCGVTIQEASSV